MLKQLLLTTALAAFVVGPALAQDTTTQPSQSPTVQTPPPPAPTAQDQARRGAGRHCRGGAAGNAAAGRRHDADSRRHGHARRQADRDFRVQYGRPVGRLGPGHRLRQGRQDRRRRAQGRRHPRHRRQIRRHQMDRGPGDAAGGHRQGQLHRRPVEGRARLQDPGVDLGRATATAVGASISDVHVSSAAPRPVPATLSRGRCR